MAFWSDPSSLLPKQSHRWVVFLDYEQNSNNSVLYYVAKSIDRPSYKIDTVQAKYLYSHAFNFPKRLVWNPIKIEFYDVISMDESYKKFIQQPIVSVSRREQMESNIKRPPPPESEEAPFQVQQTDEARASFTVGSQNGTVVNRATQASVPVARLRFPGTLQGTTETIRSGRTEIDFYKSKINKSTQLFFYDFLHKCGYFDPNEYETEDKLLRFRSYHFKKNMITALTGQETDLLNNNSDKYSKDYIVLAELDDEGGPIESWKIYNPMITDISSNKLDYSSDTIVSITVGITYDWAELEPREVIKRTNAAGEEIE